MKTTEQKLEQAKRIRGKIVQYSYINCKSITFEKMTEIILNLYDIRNTELRKQRIEYEKTNVHKWLMASKGMTGKQILIYNK